MSNTVIRLTKGEWILDEAAQVGESGGFGEVFRGNGPDGAVAIKRLKLTAHRSANRELRINNYLNQKTLVNVIPTLDAGQDPESKRFFIVMPLCEGNLQSLVDQNPAGLPFYTALPIINAVLNGLSELREINHRDLKPSNILHHDGTWKIGDFGISKFVEHATSAETMRNVFTPLYGAPEQWRRERPSAATDVYAMGCIIYALCTGQPPFQAATSDDLMDLHLRALPPPIRGVPQRLAPFVGWMLRKTPTGRPTLQDCIEAFGEIGNGDNRNEKLRHRPARDNLERVEARREVGVEAEKARVTLRTELAREAHQTLRGIHASLFSQLRLEIPELWETARQHHAILEFEPEQNLQLIEFDRWDIVCGTPVTLTSRMVRTERWYTWGASLFYARQNTLQSYRWYEATFYNSRGHTLNDPHAIRDLLQLRAAVMTRTRKTQQLAYGPVPIDFERQPEFIGRWLTLARRAINGRLSKPRIMPISSAYFADNVQVRS